MINRIKRKYIIVSAALLLFPLAAIVAINLYVYSYTAPYIYTDKSKLPQYYTVIVPGAAVYANKKVSHVFYDRLITAEELQKRGTVTKILISGDHGRKTYDEVNTGLALLASHKIAKDSIFTDHAGFDTYDTMSRARDIFLVHDAIISTQRFHLARSVFIARKLGINACGIVCDKRRYRKSRYYRLREALSTVKAFIEITFGSHPRFLGPQIPISGSADKSRG